jgi:hypothetical protein
MKMKLKLTYFLVAIFMAYSLVSNVGYSQSIYKNKVIQLEEDLVIGGDTDQENYLFTQITDISVDSKGNLVVLDSQDHCVKKYDSNGKHLRTFGSKGKGPGELELPMRMAIDPDDRIVIYELGNRRFSLFNDDGSHYKIMSLSTSVRDFDIGPAGNYYIETHDWDFSGKKGGTLIKILHCSPDLKKEIVIDSVRILDNKFIINGNSGRNIPVPYHPNLCWKILPSGNILVAYSGQYELSLFSPSLELIKKIKGKGDKIKVSKDDQELYFANITSSTNGGEIKRGASQFVRNETKFPKYKPYFSNISVDANGHILIHLYLKNNEYNVYDVFSPNGEFLNNVKMTPIHSKTIFYENYVYKAVFSDDDFPKIIRYVLK